MGPQRCQSSTPVTYPFQPNGGGHSHRGLPLNLIGLIISFLDDIADIARVTRASRLLYYMTSPRLFENVTLRSYDTIRYVNGQPEGYGSGSPFTMGLNGLATGSMAIYVRSFALSGEWKELDLEDFSKGRVPDKTMLLSIAVRAALDKMKRLESFSWDLKFKPLQTVFQGLSEKSTLTSLSLRFPSSRIPCPCILIPSMPNLRSLRLTDIDPLCYPDDISLLIASARKLESLTMIFSPRMREQGESSVDLYTYFGKLYAAPYLIPVKRVSIKNSYTRNNLNFEEAFENDALEEFTLLNSISVGNPMTVFLDESWLNAPRHEPTRTLKMCRIDSVDRSAIYFMTHNHGLERLYVVNTRIKPNANGISNGGQFFGGSSKPISSSECITLVVKYHNISLRHLLLAEDWLLSNDDLSALVHACPNLEQLALAMDHIDQHRLQLILHSLPKLYALRLLTPRDGDSSCDKSRDADKGSLAKMIDTVIRSGNCENLKWVALGPHVFGRVEAKRDGEGSLVNGHAESTTVFGPFPAESVEEIDIWRMDSLELF